MTNWQAPTLTLLLGSQVQWLRKHRKRRGQSTCHCIWNPLTTLCQLLPSLLEFLGQNCNTFSGDLGTAYFYTQLTGSYLLQMIAVAVQHLVSIISVFERCQGWLEILGLPRVFQKITVAEDRVITAPQVLEIHSQKWGLALTRRSQDQWGVCTYSGDYGMTSPYELPW